MNSKAAPSAFKDRRQPPSINRLLFIPLRVASYPLDAIHPSPPLRCLVLRNEAY